MGSTAIMLCLGWYLKAPCTSGAVWADHSVWRRGCYSDIYPLYGQRSLHNQWPYLEAFNEYPPVTAGWQAALGRLASDAGSFWKINAILLAVLAIATTLALWHGGVRQHIWGWALATPVMLYSFHNWDLLAILPATLGMVLWFRGRTGWGGALIALAACAKWYPAILLPILGMDLIRRERGLGPQGWRFGLAAIGVLAAINLPLYQAAPKGFVEPYQFHADRGATFESHWFALRHYAERWHMPGHSILESAQEHGLVYLVALAAILSFMVWRGRLEVRRAAALAIVGWLVVSPVLSVQYALWILPPLLLAGLPSRRLIPFLVADLLVFVTVWRFISRLFVESEGFDRDYEPLAVASMLRLFALLGLCAWLIRHRRAPAVEPRGARPTPAQVDL